MSKIPGGGIISFAGYTFATAGIVSGAPIITPTLKLNYGTALNGPYPVRRDGAVAQFESLRLTWKVLVQPDASTAYDNMTAKLAALFDAIFTTAQTGTLVAYTGTTGGGGTVSCLAAIVGMPYPFSAANAKYMAPELTFDVLSAFS